MQHEPSPPTPHGKAAVEFASALVAGDYEGARRLLAPDLRGQMTPEELRNELFAMFEGYSQGKPERIHYDEEFAHDDWPGKKPGDLGWVYVSIEGEGFVEAVTVIVADVDGEPLIREIEWGRP